MGERDFVSENRYEITDILGTGGMATVFLAKDTKFDVHKAVKILAPEFC